MLSRENNLANMLDVNIWFSVCTGIYQESVREIRLRIRSKCCVVFVPSGKDVVRRAPQGQPAPSYYVCSAYHSASFCKE